MFFFKQKTAYEVRISDWSSDVCSSDLKHLPMLEQYPAEALKTNIHGTWNVLQAAEMVDVERFVNVSTDKAANPTSVLGYSKRIAERNTAAPAQPPPGPHLSVRFGTVPGPRWEERRVGQECGSPCSSAGWPDH